MSSSTCNTRVSSTWSTASQDLEPERAGFYAGVWSCWCACGLELNSPALSPARMLSLSLSLSLSSCLPPPFLPLELFLPPPTRAGSNRVIWAMLRLACPHLLSRREFGYLGHGFSKLAVTLRQTLLCHLRQAKESVLQHLLTAFLRRLHWPPLCHSLQDCSSKASRTVPLPGNSKLCTPMLRACELSKFINMVLASPLPADGIPFPTNFGQRPGSSCCPCACLNDSPLPAR